MRRSVRVCVILCWVVGTACGSRGKPGAEAPVAEAAPEEAAAADKEEATKPAALEERPESGKIPDECAKKTDVCLPPESFVKWLCQESSANVALHMFKKDTPWTRGYLTRKTNAWNASGGASDNMQLEFDEEVIILRHRAAGKDGIQVSGASGGYDALRWDGACVTLAKEELTLRLPPIPKAARVEWKWLDEGIRESLRSSAKVDAAFKLRRKECQGATMGTVSLNCVKADTKLSNVIVEYVKNGGDLALPKKLP
jgi:hypothetical protein